MACAQKTMSPLPYGCQRGRVNRRRKHRLFTPIEAAKALPFGHKIALTSIASKKQSSSTAKPSAPSPSLLKQGFTYTCMTSKARRDSRVNLCDIIEDDFNYTDALMRLKTELLEALNGKFTAPEVLGETEITVSRAALSL